MDIGQRIAEARRGAGLTQTALGSAVGLTQQAIAALESGRYKETGKIVQIAAMLGVSAEFLQSGRESSNSLEGWTDVRASSQAAGMGPGRAADVYEETYHLKFRARSLSNQGLRAPALEVCYGDGESMLPRIAPGDAILFDRSDTKPAHNKIFIVRYDGHIYAKRMKKFGKHWFLATDNADADPDWRDPKPVLDEGKIDFEILGRVRWIGSWEK